MDWAFESEPCKRNENLKKNEWFKLGQITGKIRVFYSELGEITGKIRNLSSAL